MIVITPAAMPVHHRPRRLFATFALALQALLLAGAVDAAGHEYRLDPVHSRVLFAVEHLGFSKVLGTFSAPRGWLRFDPADWQSARGEVEIDLATLDLGDAGFNRRMRRSDAFDSERHPLARWVVERVEPIDASRFLAHGRLTWRGADYPLALDVQFNRLARHPLTLRRTAGFSASATLSRAALGIDGWQGMVGDAVELRVEVEARRGRAAGAITHDGTEAEDHGASQ